MSKISKSQVLTRGVAEVLPDQESLSKLMDERKIRVYLGADPTGALLTLGHGVVLRKLQQFADLGHEVILLIGNGTVRIGDPTGKDSTRPELSDEQIKENFKNWKRQAGKIIDFDKIEIKYNGDWLDKLTYTDIVKLLAKTTVQQLLERDMFQERLKDNKPIHGHEIIYPLLQGYDSVVMDVDLEIGGTDQTFNMMMGRTLQKAYNNKEKWVMTTPIINGTDGRKMSKSYGNFIALEEDPINMYGKLMSTADDELITYFEVLTDIAQEEIEEMRSQMASGANPMEFKKRLALEITKSLHSQEQAEEAKDHFERTVQNKEIPADIREVGAMAPEMSLLDLAKLTDPDTSNSQLRRVIEQGGVQLDGEKITDPTQNIKVKSGMVLKVGKRNFIRLKSK